MKGGKKLGFGGFGAAMFAINDIQNMYGNIDGKVEEPKNMLEVKPKSLKSEPIKPNGSIKTTVKQNETEKPKIILKTLTSTLPQMNKNISSQMMKKQPIHQPIKTDTDKKVQQYNFLKVAQSTFEISLSKKPSEWSYHIFPEEGKNAKEIVPNPQITFSLNERNIRQGSIGNCYFICSLAALTKNIEIIKRRIPNSEKYNPASQFFRVNMFESGKLVEISVLNSFQQNFSKPIENDITSLILEKAYAQLYGNYEIINMGHSIDSFRDLSGHIAEYIDLKDKQQCVKQIIEAFESNHPMVIASKANPHDEMISGKHSYNILSYSSKNGNFFVELRDPRGWTKASFNVPGFLQSQIENGEFWIGYEDLVKNFEVVTVSRYMPDSLYYYKTFGVKEISVSGLKAVIFEVAQPTKIGFSIHQKHKKFFDKNHQYSVVNLMVCEVDKNGQPIKTMKTNFNAQQVCSMTLKLQKGMYAVVGQIYPFKQAKQPFPEEIFTLSMNSSSQIPVFFELPQFNLQQALTIYIQENKKEFKTLISQENLHRYHGSLFGKMCILYENYSEKSVIEELEFQTENIEIKERKIILDKGQIKLLTHPIGPANNCSHKCVFKSKTFYKK